MDVSLDDNDPQSVQETEEPTPSKKSFPNLRDFVDDEAEVSDEDDVGSKRKRRGGTLDSEEEEDEDNAGLDTFLAGDSEEDDDDDEPQGSPEPIDRAEGTSELLDDDYLLIAENLGIKMKRKKTSSEDAMGKKRRLKKRSVEQADDTGESEEEEEDEVEAIESPGQSSLPAEVLRVFGDITDFLQQSNSTSTLKHLPKAKTSRSAKLHHHSVIDSIVNTDIPERFQARVSSRPQDSSNADEAEWIVHQCLHSHGLLDRAAVETVLDLMRKDHLEVPFIATYCRDEFRGALNYEQLWLIDRLDERWDKFENLRQSLVNAAKKVDPSQVSELLVSMDEEDLEDVRQLLQLKFIETLDPSHSETRQASLKQFSNAWNRFRELRAIMDPLFTENSMFESLDILAESIGHPDHIIAEAEKSAAWRYSLDPFIRRKVRSFFLDHALISTDPVPGSDAMGDPSHEFYSIRCISGKPVRSFLESDQFLLIRKAQEEGFLTTRIVISKSNMSQMVEMLTQPMPPLGDLQWSEFRRNALTRCYDMYLSRVCTSYARRMLDEAAGTRVSNLACDRLLQIAKTAPVDHRGHPIVIGIAGDHETPALFAALDASGQLQDHLVLRFLDRGGDPDAQRKDVRRLQNLLADTQPRLMFIAAQGFESRKLKELVDRLVGGMSLSVDYANPQVALLAKGTLRYSIEFRSQKRLATAVSLGRFLLDPLSEITTLSDSDLVSLSLHPLQRFGGSKRLVRFMKSALSQQICAIGLDLNEIGQLRHKEGPLSLIPGLGPQKAKHLLQEIRKSPILISRKSLLEKGFLGPVVFRNSSGFLRITGDHAVLTDSCRVHPEHTFLLDRILLNSGVVPEGFEVTDENRSEFLQKLRLDSPKLRDLDALDLKRYAEVLEERGDGRFYHLLLMVKDEVRAPFRDNSRHQRSRLYGQSLFNLITGEVIGETLCKGQKVAATVSKCSRAGVQCRLEGGIMAFIPFRELGNREEPVPGDVIEGSVIEFELDRFQVILSCRGLAEKPREDEFHDSIRWDAFSVISQPNTNPLLTQKRTIKARQIRHPRFKNINRVDCEAMLLAQKGREAIIFRPSSSGIDHLTLSFRVMDELCWHFDIQEQEKPVNFPEQLGTRLLIGKQQFEDLDDVCATFVRPLLKNVQNIVKHKNFRYGEKDELKETLRSEREQFPTKALYCFGFYKRENPGYMILMYMPGRSTCFRELIKVLPSGYVFKSETYSTLSRLVADFKKNFKNLPKGAVQQVNPRREPPSSSHDHQARLYDDRRYQASEEYSGRSKRSSYGYDRSSYGSSMPAYSPGPRYR